MNKEEFLTGLREKLLEDLPAYEVEEQIAYYRGFIDGELRKGRTEEEVTFDLGDPILIARNIAESPQSARINMTDSYQQGFAEAEYPDTIGLASEEPAFGSTIENADGYAETIGGGEGAFDGSAEEGAGGAEGASDGRGYGTDDGYGNRNMGSDGAAYGYEKAQKEDTGADADDERPYREAERDQTFDNGFFESGSKQTVETGGPASIFYLPDGKLNWKLIGILALILVTVVAVIVLAARLAIAIWPLLLVMFIISMIFSGRRR